MMSLDTFSSRHAALLVLLALPAACAQTPPATVASNPPPVPPGPAATWYHIEFTSNSHTLDAQGQLTVADVTTTLQRHPDEIATIIGKTDTVGSPDYNMHLSHLRADAVRDALVYSSNIAADRVETRWTGETRQRVATADNVAEAPNRVVDVAIH
jgi:outer membrane protein OmpA-like peptidoglycan-associated protein